MSPYVARMPRFSSALANLSDGELYDQATSCYHFGGDDHRKLGEDVMVVFFKLFCDNEANQEALDNVRQRFIGIHRAEHEKRKKRELIATKHLRLGPHAAAALLDSGAEESGSAGSPEPGHDQIDEEEESDDPL